MLEDQSQIFVERPKGKNPTGNISKLNNNKFKSIEPAIPSKYSTMFVEKDVCKGFGSSSTRFNENVSLNETNPGPGSYSIYSENINNNESLIYSKKGYGNFASNSIKMKNGIYINTGPGPGYYNKLEKNIKINIQNKKTKNNYFKPTKSKLEKLKKEKNLNKNLLGPGSYNQIKEKIKFNSAFVFKNTERIDKYNNINDNGYIKYNLKNDFIIKNKFNKKGNIIGLFPKEIKKEPLKDNITKGLEEINNKIELKNNKEIIGPGKYEVDKSFKYKNDFKPYNLKGSSNFQNGYKDRFGCLYPPFNLDELITPGPCSYNIPLNHMDKKVIKRPFLDEIPKNCFQNNLKNNSEFIYDIQPLPNKISYHLNINSKWV